jgi:hypothetical protein
VTRSTSEVPQGFWVCALAQASLLTVAACASVADVDEHGLTDDGTTSGSTTGVDDVASSTDETGEDEEDRPLESLPLEVLGLPGVAFTVDFELSAANLAAAREATLEMTVHNVVEADAAFITINDDPPMDLGTAGSPFLVPVGGHTSGRLPISLVTLVPGVNTLTFHYDRQVISEDAAISGYRVLDLQLYLDDDRVELDFAQRGPQTWAPPRTDETSIARGKSFFQEISRDGGPVCARCHADSGADLQYYGFSNRSIIARAMFHEFSREESEDIVSYIRSLSVDRVGEVFVPPFQPGSRNFAAAGAGLDAILEGDELDAHLFGAAGMPDDLDWDWPAQLDTFVLPTHVRLPDWLRWMPRRLDDDWFTWKDGALAAAEAAVRDDPSVSTANAFMETAIELGFELLIEDGHHRNRIEVLRFAGVKLWDWSRHNDFEGADHGMPDRSPAYPYEVGFAFFEAAMAENDPHLWEQTLEWWWAQIATYPGRGFSDGNRPLDWADVLLVAEELGLAGHVSFLHLFGSWESSRGVLAERFGMDTGPVELLEIPMGLLPPAERVTIMRRFLREQAQFLENGGELTAAHLLRLEQAWAHGCEALSPAQRTAVRQSASPDVLEHLAACP